VALLLPAFAEISFYFDDPLLVPLVKGPLLDALRTKQTGLHKDAQMLASGWLSNTQLLSDKEAAYAVFHKVTCYLRWKMSTRIL